MNLIIRFSPGCKPHCSTCEDATGACTLCTAGFALYLTVAAPYIDECRGKTLLSTTIIWLIETSSQNITWL